MFSLDNIELDFDDDFSTSIFSRGDTSGKGNSLHNETVSHKPNPAPDSPSTPKLPFREKSIPDNRTPATTPVNLPPTTQHKENSFKRPCLQDEKPHKKRLSHDTLLQRRFPGPAGLLPDKPFNPISHSALPAQQSWLQEEHNPEKDKPIIYSQSSGSVFLESAYQKFLSDFNLNDSDNPLNKYTVEWLKRTALSKGLQGRKIPFLGLVVHEVNHSMPDPVLVLRDPTGEINGSLHREVWAEMGGKLREGIALALRQVGVLITGVIRRQIYLNITMNNILAIYSPSDTEVDITTVNRIPPSDLLRNFPKYPHKTVPKLPPTPSFPLTTIEHSNRSPAEREQMRRNWKDRTGGGSGVVGEEMMVPESVGGGGGGGVGAGAVAGAVSRQELSPAESLIFEEVLSGIDLDEFDS